MVEIEVVRLLQHYRHDLMNRLQLVQGYLSMGKTEKAASKMNELFSYLNEERKLIGLEAPNFILWLIQFNHSYKNFRMAYTIHIENESLHEYDQILLSKSKYIMNYLEETCNPSELYYIDFVLQENNESSVIEGHFLVEGFHNHTFTINEENIDIIQNEEGIIGRFQLQRN
ncbi:Spo0B domain-containing protein [Oceanobacillus senegalensis]|uniref:Spo0B domain-containing protein n=1 Tax=Oceanobacillus senegalensis TaxID=1936063 RepID=UPI000A313369|nr:Spo0B domain-containing protein [Oceanobacillus senegalensis]